MIDMVVKLNRRRFFQERPEFFGLPLRKNEKVHLAGRSKENSNNNGELHSHTSRRRLKNDLTLEPLFV